MPDTPFRGVNDVRHDVACDICAAVIGKRRRCRMNTGPYVLYLPGSGRLLVDMNGTEPGGRFDVAMVSGAPALGFWDFQF